MKIVLVLVCIFSCYQAQPLNVNGSEPVLINSKPEQIPEVSTEVTKIHKSNTAKGKKIEFIPPPITPTAATTVSPPSSTNSSDTSISPTSSTISSPTTSITQPTTPTAPTTPSTPITHPTPPINPTTTSIPPKTSSTEHPPSPTSRPTIKPVVSSTPVVPTNRGFDGPSFIGGIVLAAGLMAIGFVAFKFYKARTELNYHTL